MFHKMRTQVEPQWRVLWFVPAPRPTAYRLPLSASNLPRYCPLPTLKLRSDLSILNPLRPTPLPLTLRTSSASTKYLDVVISRGFAVSSSATQLEEVSGKVTFFTVIR